MAQSVKSIGVILMMVFSLLIFLLWTLSITIVMTKSYHWRLAPASALRHTSSLPGTHLNIILVSNSSSTCDFPKVLLSKFCGREIASAWSSKARATDSRISSLNQESKHIQGCGFSRRYSTDGHWRRNAIYTAVRGRLQFGIFHFPVS